MKGVIQITKLDKVSNIIKNSSFETIKILKKEYKIEYSCSAGHKKVQNISTFIKPSCKICDIRKEIELLDYELLEDYISWNGKLKMICPRGHFRECSIDSFRRFRCQGCLQEDKLSSLVNEITTKGYTILSVPENTHGKLKAICPNKHYREAKIYNFINYDCERCYDKRKYTYTYDEVKAVFEQRGFRLLSTSYSNCKEKLKYECTCKRVNLTTFDTINNSNISRCISCKGSGTSSLSTYGRNHLVEWKKSSMFHCKYKCFLTDEAFDHIHHITGFNIIVKETLEKLNFPILEDISKYTEIELEAFKDEIQKLHIKYGNGICLSEKVHKQFHKQYGSSNNTYEQFLKFVKENYPYKEEKFKEFFQKIK